MREREDRGGRERERKREGGGTEREHNAVYHTFDVPPFITLKRNIIEHILNQCVTHRITVTPTHRFILSNFRFEGMGISIKTSLSKSKKMVDNVTSTHLSLPGLTLTALALSSACSTLFLQF